MPGSYQGGPGGWQEEDTTGVNAGVRGIDEVEDGCRIGDLGCFLRCSVSVRYQCAALNKRSRRVSASRHRGNLTLMIICFQFSDQVVSSQLRIFGLTCKWPEVAWHFCQRSLSFPMDCTSSPWCVFLDSPVLLPVCAHDATSAE